MGFPPLIKAQPSLFENPLLHPTQFRQPSSAGDLASKPSRFMIHWIQIAPVTFSRHARLPS